MCRTSHSTVYVAFGCERLVTLLDGDGVIEGCSLRLLQTNYRVMITMHTATVRDKQTAKLFTFPGPAPSTLQGKMTSCIHTTLSIEGGIFWCIGILGRHL